MNTPLSERLREWIDRHGGAQNPVARRVIVSVMGFTILVLGIVMIVLPGPAILVIPAGLAVLAIEFEWARRWLKRLREMAGKVPRWKRTQPVATAPQGEAK